MKSAPQYLLEASETLIQRGKTYDVAGQERSMAKVVEVFNTLYNTKLTEAQGWHFMRILKDVRQISADSFHEDSAIDLIAYSALHAECLSKG